MARRLRRLLTRRKKNIKERDDAVKNEYVKLKQFLQRQQENAKPNQTFQVYYEPKDDVVTAVNYYKSMRDNAAAIGDKKTAKDCEDRIRKMLKDDKSWEYCFLIDFDTTSTTTTGGLNAVVKDQRTDNATFTRIRDYT